MQTFHRKKGLDLPVTGAPDQTISDAAPVRQVAVLGADYLGLKPRLAVAEGDTVGAGAPLFAHKDTPEVQVVAPVSGRVVEINRGAQRKLISVVIEADESAAAPLDFSDVGGTDRAGLTEKLCAAGLWTSFRTRPYSKVPAPGTVPAALFVTAMESDPLAPDAAVIIADARAAFARGLAALTVLTDGPTYLCQRPGADIPTAPEVTPAAFAGPHPAGLAGTHIHFLHALRADAPVWTIGYSDVIAIGRLLETGQVSAERVIALAGPLVTRPRLVRTVAGAEMSALTAGEIDAETPARLISGSILSGRAGTGTDGYLGRYARQLTVMEEDHKQTPLGWIRPMASRYAVQPVLGSAFSKRLFSLTTNLNGGRRAMVPLGTFEELMPQDFLPTQLVRALLVMDTDSAQALGALELDEEDLGLIGFACPAKYEYGLALRECLTKIEKEG